MKPTINLLAYLALSAASVMPAMALTWNDTGATDNWNTTDGNWDSGSMWTNGSAAGFSGIGETVTLAETGITAGTVTFSAGGYTINTNGQNTTWATLAGSSGFTKSGTGTLTLTNASTASGTVAITGGRITLGNNTALGTASVTLNGGTLERNAAGQIVANAITIGAGGGTILGRQTVDDYTTFSGQLTGSGPLTIQGLVTLNNNTNTFSGPVTISNASSTYFRLSASGVLPSSTDLTFGGANSRLRLDGGVTQAFDSFSGTAGEVFMSAFGTSGTSATLKIGNDSSSSSFGGTFSNNDGQLNLEKIGGGTLTLNRGAGNGGQITSVKVTGGKLVLDGASVGFDAGYFTGTQSYTVGTGATLEVNRGWNTRSANVYNINGGTLSFTATAGDINYVNNLNLTNGTVSGGEFRTGNNTLATHTFAGDSGSTISSSIRLIKNGATQTARFDVANGAAANDLTISGLIKDDGSFPGSTVEKTGTGTMLVSSGNTYAGPTLISQGTVITTHNNGLGTGGTVTLNSTLTGTNSTALYAQTASSGDLVLSRPITVANQGTGTTTIGTSRTGGGRTFFDGLLTINKNVTLSGMLTDRTQFRGGIRGTGNVTVAGGSRTTFSDSTADTEGVEGSALFDFTGNLTLTGAGTTVQYNSDIELTNAPTVTVETGTTLRSAYGKTLRINSLAGAGTVTSVAGSGTLVVGINGGGGNFSGVIAGTGGDALKLTKTGSGNQILSGTAANTYTGLTTVNAGTLTLDKNDGVIAIPGHVLVTGTGTLATSANKSGRIADSANVTIDGAGASFQFGDNQNDTIAILAVNNGGTVNIGGTNSNLRPNGGISSTGGGSITMSAGGAGLNFNGATRAVAVADSTLSIDAPITNGGLTKSGNGTLSLGKANTYTGATTVNAGTLLVTDTLGATAVTVESGGTLGGTGTLGGSLTFAAGANLDLTGASLGLSSTDILSVASGQSITLSDFAFADIIGWDYANATDGTYTLINGGGTVTFGGSTPTFSNPFDFGNGKLGYFQQGSLQAVIIPEPSIVLLGGIGALGLAMRRGSQR
ncbi:MAG: autotransporter-associated beta strand repeat-containing protein [Verrucomicrobia bacterium]|nr:autotransporter-associated beta strand repeat-containing protein [Verrucomicrobiota bacterium]